MMVTEAMAGTGMTGVAGEIGTGAIAVAKFARSSPTTAPIGTGMATAGLIGIGIATVTGGSTACGTATVMAT